MDGPDDDARGSRRTIESLHHVRDVFEAFFDSARVGMAITDLSCRYLRVNRTYAELLARAPEDLIGMSLTDIVRADGDGPGLVERVGELLSGRGTSLTSFTSEERYVSADGRHTWVLHVVTVVRDAAGRPAWFAVSAQDVTERHLAEQGLRDLTATLAERAVRDPLTGLANRVLLEERLRGTLARDARTNGSTSLLFLDLDGFKDINDRHGHAVGDQVLKEVAARLATGVRPSDLVARPGGDEFVVLAEGTDEITVRALVERLSTALWAPIPVSGTEVTVGVSIGVAVSHRGETDPASMLAEADRSMYGVKRSRRAAARAQVPRPR